jgi:hypothetical protein
MLCNWNQWRISKALDTGSPLPRSLERHLLGCEACREYHRFSSTLPHKGQTDLSTLLSTDTGDLSTRVLAGLDRAGDFRTEQRRRSPLRIPAYSAAVTVTALILGFVLLRPPASPDLSQLNPLAEWRSVESTLSGLVKSMDSPYRTELENLRSSLNTTADFFRSFLDIRLGEEE